MSIYDIEVKDIDMNSIKMEEFKGKTLLIVNVASACGFTPQYTGLQSLYDKYKDKGSLEFAKELMLKADVAVSPGVAFGEFGEGFVRVGLVENEQRIRQAAKNIKKLLY